MSAPAMHYEAQSAALPACETCGAHFTPKRGWARFCSTPCRNAFHGAERRKEAIRARALDLYAALAALAGHGVPVAIEAIKDLKPPIEPKDLLKP